MLLLTCYEPALACFPVHIRVAVEKGGKLTVANSCSRGILQSGLGLVLLSSSIISTLKLHSSVLVPSGACSNHTRLHVSGANTLCQTVIFYFQITEHLVLNSDFTSGTFRQRTPLPVASGPSSTHHSIVPQRPEGRGRRWGHILS